MSNAELLNLAKVIEEHYCSMEDRLRGKYASPVDLLKREDKEPTKEDILRKKQAEAQARYRERKKRESLGL